MSERAAYRDVVFANRLHGAIARLNPGLAPDRCEEAFRKSSVAAWEGSQSVNAGQQLRTNRHQSGR